MNYWILTLESQVENFTIINPNQKFSYIYADKNGALDLEVFRPNDYILGYINAPTSTISYIFSVNDIQNEKLILTKEFEFKGLPKAILLRILPEFADYLIDRNEELLISLEKDQYHKIISNLFKTLSNSEIDENLSEQYSLPLDDETPLISMLPFSHNRIIFGAPGTGKSYKLKSDMSNEDTGEVYFTEDHFERVTFYPNYSYGQFFGTYKPKKEIIRDSESGNEESKITYEFVPGPFFRLLLRALGSKQSSQPENFLLIIEEINRANAAAVFGDVFQLLDRNDDGESEYSITLSEDALSYMQEKHPTISIQNNEIKIPSNLYIWATMNNADQGVQPIDSAFKRRFDFEYIGINANEHKIENISVTIPGMNRTINWNKFRKFLNEFLIENFPHVKEDKLIGPFFIKESTLRNSEKFGSAFKNKLLMYLSEDILKTANKEILFSARTYSKIIELYEAENVENRRVFSPTFYNELEDKLRRSRGTEEILFDSLGSAEGNLEDIL